MKVKAWWDKFVERISREPTTQQERESIEAGVEPPTMPPRAPMDESANDRALVDVRDDNPVFKAVMDHAYRDAGGYLHTATDINAPWELRRDALAAFTGIRNLIGNVEYTRARLQEKRVKDQKKEALREAEKERLRGKA